MSMKNRSGIPCTEKELEEHRRAFSDMTESMEYKPKRKAPAKKKKVTK